MFTGDNPHFQLMTNEEIKAATRTWWPRAAIRWRIFPSWSTCSS